MTGKQLVAALRSVFDKWEKLLAATREQELTARTGPNDWSVSDVVAHLMAWQQVSIARLEAALSGTDPKYPDWLDGADPFFAEEHVDEFNGRIWKRYRDQPWSTVHRTWRDNFLRYIGLAEAVPENELREEGRYPWLNGWALSAVLDGSLEHHQHHYDAARARLA